MWMKPEDSLLSTIGQSRKDTYFEVLRGVQFTETESGRVDCRSWGQRKEEW